MPEFVTCWGLQSDRRQRKEYSNPDHPTLLFSSPSTGSYQPFSISRILPTMSNFFTSSSLPLLFPFERKVPWNQLKYYYFIQIYIHLLTMFNSIAWSVPNSLMTLNYSLTKSTEMLTIYSWLKVQNQLVLHLFAWVYFSRSA